MLPPHGVFGILSSWDERVAAAIGLVALVSALAYDKFADSDLDM